MTFRIITLYLLLFSLLVNISLLKNAKSLSIFSGLISSYIFFLVKSTSNTYQHSSEIFMASIALSISF